MSPKAGGGGAVPRGPQGLGPRVAAARLGESSGRANRIVCPRGSVSTRIQNCLSTLEPFWGPEESGPTHIPYTTTLIQELGSTKTYERISTDERSIVNTHSIDITAKFAVSIKEKQDRLPTLYWLPKLHKRPYKARSIAISSSCTTTVLSKLLTSCLTAVKKTLD